MMAVNIGDKPLAGFDQPIEMMKDCHRRIEHFLDVLRRVEEQLGGSPLNDEGRRALGASLRYFAHAAPRHTADEERSLFPRMRRREIPEVQAALAELEHLEHDHRRAEMCHAQVDEIVHQWLAAGCLEDNQRRRLRELLDELTTIYAAHIRLEEQHVFALATRILDAEQLQAIGREMQQRRAVV